jgi:hypothetical protein
MITRPVFFSQSFRISFGFKARVQGISPQKTLRAPPQGGDAPARLRPRRGVYGMRVRDAAKLRVRPVKLQVRGHVRRRPEGSLDDLPLRARDHQVFFGHLSEAGVRGADHAQAPLPVKGGNAAPAEDVQPVLGKEQAGL